ncbi:hypothetical protein HPP92_006256 [Vanilla planifolia]|uniref:Uncharacterized protein n=1 Tax=Vanilla planifolia TaxID=51239 RepID=A0A835VDY8_VANPL|nr:hypothetical protein HPP92_006256 [Vanilla planifolia]
MMNGPSLSWTSMVNEIDHNVTIHLGSKEFTSLIEENQTMKVSLEKNLKREESNKLEKEVEARAASKNLHYGLMEDLEKATQEINHLNSQIKMIQGTNKLLQEYNNSLQQYNLQLQADAIKNGDTISKLQKEKNALVEIITRLTDQASLLRNQCKNMRHSIDASLPLNGNHEDYILLRWSIFPLVYTMHAPGWVGVPRPKAIIDWLQNEMGYPSQLPFVDRSARSARETWSPCGVFSFKDCSPERATVTVHQNTFVHGVVAPAEGVKVRRWEKEKGSLDFEDGSSLEAKEVAMRERDLAMEEAVRLRNVVRWQRKELRSRMAEVEREESKPK